MDDFLEKRPKKHSDAALATAELQQGFPGGVAAPEWAMKPRKDDAAPERAVKPLKGW